MVSAGRRGRPSGQHLATPQTPVSPLVQKCVPGSPCCTVRTCHTSSSDSRQLTQYCCCSTLLHAHAHALLAVQQGLLQPVQQAFNPKPCCRCSGMVYNEATGRTLQIGKVTYNKLLKEGYQVGPCTQLLHMCCSIHQCAR